MYHEVDDRNWSEFIRLAKSVVIAPRMNHDICPFEEGEGAHPLRIWDGEWLNRQAEIARGYYELGLLDEAEAELELPVDSPQHWLALVQAPLGLIAWARGDMESVAKICPRWHRVVPQKPKWYWIVATALS